MFSQSAYSHTSITNEIYLNKDDLEDTFLSNKDFSNKYSGFLKEKDKKLPIIFQNHQEYENIKSIILIYTINAIYGEFKSFVKDLPDFACFILKDDILTKQINECNSLETPENEKIQVLINYLRDKDFSFQTLVLDFKNYPNSSAEQVHEYLLKYFLKSSKQKLLERAFAILYPSLDTNYLETKKISILKDINTYKNLIYFALKGKIDDEKTVSRFLSNSRTIPLILLSCNEVYLNNYVYKDNIPITVYCQLQLVFDYIDNSNNNPQETNYHYSEEIAKPKLDNKPAFVINVTSNQNNSSDDQIKYLTWNDGNIGYTFKNGILFKETNLIIKQSNKTLKSSAKNDTNFPRKIKSKRYKFFSFDKNNNKWEYNKSAFDEFSTDFYKTHLPDLKIPLVYFFNSDEKDSFDLCKNLIDFVPLESDDDQICIYGLCDAHSLFLLLHVPNDQNNNPNIGRILFQIHSFLFVISDIVIVIINESSTINQFTLFKDIIEINNSFDIKEKGVQISDDVDDQNDGFDYLFDRLSDGEFVSFSTDDIKTQLLVKFENFIKKDLNFIFLLNSLKSDAEKDKQSTLKKQCEQFLPKNKKLLESIKYSDIIIGIIDKYANFLKVFNSLSNKCFSQIDEIQSNFQYLPLFEMTNIYINCRRDKMKYTKELKEIINCRYKFLKKCKDDDDFAIMTELQKEIHSIYPLLDKDFSKLVDANLSELVSSITQENKNVILENLQNISKTKLNELSNVIKSRQYWTYQQIENIKMNHIHFLKDGFFNIIKCMFPETSIFLVYKDNEDIINNQIKKDKKTIQEMFCEFFTKLNINKIEKEVDLEEGTNYTIRERENEREVKVRVEIGGKLEDLIKQDF